MDPITYAYAGDIMKFEETDDGGLMVFGKATGPDLDLDDQVCDPDWLRKEMPNWMEWGNVREMHGNVLAGVGKELTADGDDWLLRSKCIDPVAATKIREGGYKGYSIGIKNARVVRDAKAPGGRIVGGTIAEISYVDRPCNPTAKMAICKMAGGTLRPVDSEGEPVGDDPASFTDGEDVLDDGTSVPVVDKAVHVDEPPVEPVTKAEPPAPAPKTKPAKPANLLSVRAYKAATAVVDKTLTGDLVKAYDESGDIAGAWAAISQICDLIIHEASELKTGRMEEKQDIELLCQALCALQCFIERETMQQAGSYGPDDDGADDGTDLSYVQLMAKFVSAAQRRRMGKTGVAMPNGDFPIPDEGHLRSAVGRLANYTGDKAAARRHIIRRARALGVKSGLDGDTAGKGKSKKNKAADSGPETSAAPATETVTEIVNKAVAEASAASEERIKALEAELAKVMSAPIPGGPVLITPAASPARPPGITKAAQYEAMALRATDPSVAAGYRDLARREAAADHI